MAGHGGFRISRRITKLAFEQGNAGDTAGPRAGWDRSTDLRVTFGPGLRSTTRRPFDHDDDNLGKGDDNTRKGDEKKKKRFHADEMKGFRHLLPSVPDPPRFKIYDVDPHKDQPTTVRLRRLMSRLATSFDVSFPWTAHESPAAGNYPALANWENPEIPAGYTYLLQLVAHDLVATSFSLAVLEDTTTGAANTRSAVLRLDTIYGGGPAVCPFAYTTDEHSGTTRTTLRLGPMKDPPGDVPKMRDIARVPAPDAGCAYAEMLTEVAIADPRNDDHAIISQMTTLFHMLHKTILDFLKLPKDLDSAIADSLPESNMDRFLCARAAVTLIYRRIIRDDLLQKILHPDVYEFYAKRPPGFEFLEGNEAPHADPRIPVEFAHAVFRFGHAMVRHRYLFNELNAAGFSLPEVLKQNSDKLPHQMPFDRTWIARWSYFFEMNNTRPNLSRRIGPEFSGGFIDPVVLDDVDEVEDRAGLAYRDLLVGGFLNLWSVPALIEVVKKRQSSLFKKSKLFSGPDYKIELKQYLESRRDAAKFEDADIESLVKEPPLAFFVLWEAAADPGTRGLKLGLLGSIIVAEVIFGAMMRDPMPGEGRFPTLKENLEALSLHTFEKNYFEEVDEISSMDQLIKFVARRNNLENEVPGFI